MKITPVSPQVWKHF